MVCGLANPSAARRQEHSSRHAVEQHHLEIAPMAPAGHILPPRSLSGLLQSYGHQLRGWTGSIALRYILAVICLLAAGAGVVAAAGVGLAALFRWIDVNYGATFAYAGV